MAVPRTEKAYEKYAWIVLLILVIFNFPFGLSDIFRPVDPTSTPEAVFGIRLYGMAFTGLNIFGLAIILKSFRKGERWAWYSLWYYPIFYLALSFFQQTVYHPFGPIAIYLAILFAIVYAIGLLLPYRKFFPKKQLSAA